MSEVVMVIGAGSIGQAIARRVSAGKHVILADLHSDNAEVAVVMAEAVRWGSRGARINTISPGTIFTPLARDELTGPRGAGYRRMIELCPAGRGGTPDEVGTGGGLAHGSRGRFHHW